MRRNQRVYSHSLRASLVLLGVLVLAPQHLWAQQRQPATCTDWTSIQSWSGTITVSGAGQANDPVNIGTTYTTSVQGTISFAAATNPSGSNLCGPNIGQSWSALNSQATYSVNIH